MGAFDIKFEGRVSVFQYVKQVCDPSHIFDRRHFCFSCEAVKWPLSRLHAESCFSFQKWKKTYQWSQLGKIDPKDYLNKGSHRIRKVQFFLTLFKRPLTPPPLSFEHYVVNFSEGILTKVRKCLSRQLSTK